ncbi:MAG: amidohydrolase family protein [Actinobacteria bacterium]|nr:amidohydrolase family protein [Actinomycetota bacterium]
MSFTLRGGLVGDGTGAPGAVADISVEDGRITAIGPAAGPASSAIDVTGCVVAPGFVDLHTHYDAQLFWDPTASPSPLHGVTTVFGGNCGFGLAPAADEDVEYLTRLMARVEGIPLQAIEAGVPFDWSGFGDWLARIEDNGTAVNAGFLAGHSAIRRAVMGDRAVGEPASAAEIDAMVGVLRDMLAAGAVGFSTSRSHTHHDGDGNPIPSRFATDDELLALCGAVSVFPGTQLEAIVPGCINGFTADEKAMLARMSSAADRPLNWNVLGVSGGDGHLSQLAASDYAAAHGARVVALTIPAGMKLRLSFLSGMVLDALPGWEEILGLPVDERLAALSDPAVRKRMDEGAHSPDAGMIGLLATWENLRIVETFAPENAPYEGRSVKSIARASGQEPFDALLDIVVADRLRTGVSPAMPPESPEVWKARVEVWRDPRVIVGGSDAGAHLDMMCGATYSSFLVGPAVREHGLLSIEEAVWLLTGAPAGLYGLTDRGRLEVGAAADLVVFDPSAVAPREERTRDDLPGGTSRLYAEADGFHHVYVNGVEIVRDGGLTGATPGSVLRAGRDTTTVRARPDREHQGEP